MTLFCYLHPPRAYKLNCWIYINNGKKWHLIVNMTKTNVTIFNEKRKKEINTFTYKKHIIKQQPWTDLVGGGTTFALKLGRFFSNLEALQKTYNLSRTLTLAKSIYKLTQNPTQRAVKSCLTTSPKLPNTSPKVNYKYNYWILHKQLLLDEIFTISYKSTYCPVFRQKF